MSPAPRSPLKLVLLALAGVALFAAFMALGVWQVYRLEWKLDLIGRAQARVNAEPVAPPGRAAWPTVNAEAHEYLHVRVRGHYIADAQTLVRATTRRGRGFWVMTPLATQRGFIALINRGFVAADMARDARASLSTPSGQVTVTGLLRMSEADGRFLRPNDPRHGRWYSRDVASIAAYSGLPVEQVAPYFIDADEGSTPQKPPIGGMTVVHFRNAHLMYALTWFVLAGLTVVGAVIVIRYERRRRREPAADGRDGGST